MPLWLAGPEFGLSQKGIALFALAGVAGAVAAPIAGRQADRGRGRGMTMLAMLLAAGAFVLGQAGTPGSPVALAALTTAAIVLDFGVAANLVVGQRAIFALGAAYRSRLNGLFMAIFFTGGAVASAVGAWALPTAAGRSPAGSALACRPWRACTSRRSHGPQARCRADSGLPGRARCAPYPGRNLIYRCSRAPAHIFLRSGK